MATVSAKKDRNVDQAKPIRKQVRVDLPAVQKQVTVELSAICVPKEQLSAEIIEYLQADLSQNASFDEQIRATVSRAVHLMVLGLNTLQQEQVMRGSAPIGSGGSGVGVITEAFTGQSSDQPAEVFDRQKALADTQDLASLF